MGGSAILDPNNLLDDLSRLVDDLRDDLNTDFGVRAFRVYTVTETWASGRVGDGTATIVETEITPQPLVRPYAPSGLGLELRACGLDEAGFIVVDQISISYTEAELTGRAVVAGVQQSIPSNKKFWYRIREAHGQGQSYRDFKLSGPPFPDRIKTIGWKARLIKIEETI